MDQQPETINASSFVQAVENLPYGRFALSIGSPRDPVGPGIQGIANAVASVIVNGVSFVGRKDCGEGLFLAATLGDPARSEQLGTLDQVLMLLVTALVNAPDEGVDRANALREIAPIITAIAVEMNRIEGGAR